MKKSILSKEQQESYKRMLATPTMRKLAKDLEALAKKSQNKVASR